MSQIAISPNSTGTGVFTIAAPGTSTNRTLTLPDATTTFVGTDASQTLTNKTLGSGLVMSASAITSGTVQTSTSGTSIDFTSIPSWVKRITVMFNGVSTNGTSSVIVQIGDSGGVETSGYTGSSGSIVGGVVGQDALSSGFLIRSPTAAYVRNGTMELALLDSATNTWSCMAVLGQSNVAQVDMIGGIKALSATLDRVRITSTNGTDTFDAGSINILYE